jgi:hypothetical protein
MFQGDSNVDFRRRLWQNAKIEVFSDESKRFPKMDEF